MAEPCRLAMPGRVFSWPLERLKNRCGPTCAAPLDSQQLLSRCSVAPAETSLWPWSQARLLWLLLGRTCRLSMSATLQANPGKPCLGTLMSRPGSYAFRPGQPSCVIDSSDPAAPVFTEPNAREREVMLGYPPGS